MNESNIQAAEELTSDDGRIAEMLGNLPRVEAPANFEFGVKARIAAGNPSAAVGAVGSWAIRFAAPTALALFFVAGVVYYTLPENGGSVAIGPAPAPSVELASAPPATSPNGALRSESVPTTEPIEAPATSAAPRRLPAPVVASSRRSSSRPRTIDASLPSRGGSVDQTLRNATTINPPGIPDERASQTYSVGDVFERLGVKVEYSGSAWRVLSSSPTGIGGKAGVAAGDVIETLDGMPLTEKTTFSGKFAAKALRVGRGGKSVDIVLPN